MKNLIKLTFKQIFLTWTGVLLSATALAALNPDDIRVDSFVNAKWGQYTHDDTENGTPCYNSKIKEELYGEDQHFERCGCVATATGMALRYWRYPETYEWDNMPFSTMSGVSDDDANAIGTFLRDIAIWSGAEYEPATNGEQSATYIYMTNVVQALTRPTNSNGFGYAEARYIDFRDADTNQQYSVEMLKKLVIPCCDYGSPIVLTVDPENATRGNRHAITIDGYAYSNGTFCVHARCGANGLGDGWFVPTSFDILGRQFVHIKEAIFNIFPQVSGTILSGRVLDPNGNVAAGADVILEDANGNLQQVKTSDNGIYAFVVPVAGKCTVVAAMGVSTARATFTVEENETYVSLDAPWKIANTYGNDLTLEEPEEEVEEIIDEDDLNVTVGRPTLSPSGVEKSGLVSVAITSETQDAIIRYTADFSEPTVESPVYTGPIALTIAPETGVQVIRARAWKDGLEASDEVVGVYKPDYQTVATPTIAVKAKNGKSIALKNGAYTFTERATISLACKTAGATIRYTTDGSEPNILSTVYTAPFDTTDDRTIRVKAWKDYCYTSDEAVFTIAYDPNATVMRGDDYANAVVIEGAEGTKILPCVSKYTLTEQELHGNNKPLYGGVSTDSEGNEQWPFNGWFEDYSVWTYNYWVEYYNSYDLDPTDVLQAWYWGRKPEDDVIYKDGFNHIYAKVGENIKGRGLKEVYHTAWFEWTAPMTDRVGFTLACVREENDFNWQVAAAVYPATNSEITLAERITYSDTTNAYNSFSFEAVSGTTYRIVAMVPYHDLSGITEEWDEEVWDDEYQSWGAWVTNYDATAYYELSWVMNHELPDSEAKLIDLASATVVLSNYVHGYTGQPWYPRIAQVVCNGTALRPYTDYTYSYLNNTDVSTNGLIMLSGCGDYTGMTSERYVITKRRITDSMVSRLVDEPYQNGAEIRPEIEVKLSGYTFAEGSEYEVTYSNNVNRGTAYVTVSGIGNFYGSVQRTFRIVDCPIGEIGKEFGPSALKTLGVDYDTSRATSVSAVGLPAGLTCYLSNTVYWVGGVPTETFDNLTRRAYLVINSVGGKTVLPLNLIVNDGDGAAAGVLPATDLSTLRADLTETDKMGVVTNGLALVTAGVRVKLPVTLTTEETGLTMTASDLPPGFSLVDKKDGTWAIEGVATKTGLYFATLTAKKGSVVKGIGTAAFRVEAEPDWAKGSFTGSFEGGSLSVTIDDANKVAIKAQPKNGALVSLTTTGYTGDLESPALAICEQLADGVVLDAIVTNYVTAFKGVTFTNAVLVGRSGEALAYRNPWSNAKLAAKLSEVTGYYTHVTADGDSFSLTIDAKAMVTIKGSFGSNAVTATVPLDITEDGSLSAYFYLAEKSLRLTLVPEHLEPDAYGNNAYRNGAVTASVVLVGDGGTNSGSVTLDPEFGQAECGATVTLTAVPDKGATFVKWIYVNESGETNYAYTTKFQLTATGRDMLVKALFRDNETIQNPYIVFDGDAFAAMRVGVPFDQTITVQNSKDDANDDLVRPVKYTASNLPAGLKLDATTGRITGIPTRAQSKPFAITATSTVNSGKYATRVLVDAIDDLPAWSLGTFVGKYDSGSISLTVAAGGKQTGKVVTNNVTWTCSASSFDSAKDNGFVLAADMKSGRLTASLTATLTNYVATFRNVVFTNAVVTGDGISAYRNPWGDKRLATALDAIAGVYAYKWGTANLTLTLDAKGSVKVAGKVGDRTVSASATLDVYESGDLGVYVYLPAKGNDKELALTIGMKPYNADQDGKNAYRNAAVSYDTASIENCSGEGTVTVSPKYGQVASGKTVTLTAKANTGSAFVKWLDGSGEVCGYDAKLTVTSTGADKTYTAVFIDKNSIEDPRIEVDLEAFKTLRMGVEFSALVGVKNQDNENDDRVRPVKFSATGLPAGLKIDSVSGLISGVPSKVVKASENKTFTVIATSTANSSKKGTATVSYVVAELPAWAQGTFSGSFEGEGGSLSLTAAANGRLSGKVALGGTNWTYSANGYASESAGPTFTVYGDMKSGKAVLPLDMAVTNYVATFRGVEFTNAVAASESAVAYRNPWGDKRLATALDAIAGVYAYEWGATNLTLTLDAKGSVKVAGKVGGRTVSASVTLDVYESGDLGVYVYLPAKGNDKELALTIGMKPYNADQDGENAYRNAAVSYDTASIENCSGEGTVTVSPKYGQVASGKTVTLTAKANTGSAFVKWLDGSGEVCGYDAKLTVTSTDADITYTAVFIDKNSIEMPRIEVDQEAFKTLRMGVEFSALVGVKNQDNENDDRVRPVKFSATGLPAGLKIDSVSGLISGVPSKVVKASENKTFTVTATSTANSSKKGTATVSYVVAELPAWAQGTFSGSFEGGSLSLTAAANGRLSGKVALGGTNWTYSANGYASESAGPTFTVYGDMKSGKAVLPLDMAVTNYVATFRGVEFTNAVAVSESAVAYRNPWGDKRLATALDAIAGVYAYKWGATNLTLTLDAKGSVKVAGNVGDRTVSASATLDVYESGDLGVYVYLTAKGNDEELALTIGMKPYNADQDGKNAYRNAAVSYDTASIENCSGEGTVTVSPKYGQVASGKTVTLTAKANTGSAFVKWLDGSGEVCGYDAKLTVTSTGADKTYTAVFIDKNSIEMPRIKVDPEAFKTLRMGVEFSALVDVKNQDNENDDLVRPVKFSATGLPAGLKIDSVSGFISGVPSKVVKASENKTFTVTATSTANSSKKGTATVSYVVAELPAWAQGTFAGSFEGGSLSLTAAANGRLSGKVAIGGTNWTYSANGYASESAGPTFTVYGDMKSGKAVLPLDMAVTNYVATFRGVEFTNAVAASESAVAYRNPWGDKRLKDSLKTSGLVQKWTGCSEDEPDLSFTIDAAGNVRTAGKLSNGRSVSASSPLLIDEESKLFTYIYLAPIKGKYKESGIAIGFETP